MKKLIVGIAMLLCCSGLFAKQHFICEYNYYSNFVDKVNELIDKGYTILETNFSIKDAGTRQFYYTILYEDNNK